MPARRNGPVSSNVRRRMPLPQDFLDALRAPPLEEIVGAIQRSRTEKSRRAMLELRNEIKPLDLFCYLGARFGPPNGIQNILRNDHSDNLVHWDWTLKYNDVMVSFWGTNFRTDLFVVGEIEFAEAERLELIQKVLADLRNHGPQMGKVRKELERWTEFVNPYWRLTRAINSLQVELNSLNLATSLSTNFNTPSSAVDQGEEWRQASSAYSKAFGLCFGIRSMLPVWAEAFLNLLIFIQARPEIKADARHLESIFRQQIDLRIKGLHIHCFGFEKPVDYSTPACKKFHTLINERNDLLHGNVVPEKQKFNEVYFIGKVPVFTEYRSLWERTLGVDSQAVGLDRLQAEVATVSEFKEYILSCLKPEVGDFMRFALKKRHLAKNHEDGRFGILFPDHLVDSRPHFGPRPESELNKQSSVPDDA